MRVVSSIIRPTSRAAAASTTWRGFATAGAIGRPSRSTARSISIGAGICPRLAMAAASSAPCIGDSVECQKPAAVRANSRWSSPGTSRCDGSIGQLERDCLVEAEAAADAGEVAGGQVARRQLGDDRVLGLAQAERQRVAAAIDRRQIDEVVGENRRDAAVVAGAGAAHDAVLDQRGRGDHLEHRRGGGPGAQRQLRRAQARIGRRLPDQREHAAVGDRDDDGAAERDLEGAQKVLRRLLQARIQRQLGAAAVGEIGDVAMAGEADRVGADERRGRFGGVGARRFGAGGGQESGRCEEPDDETGCTRHIDTVIHVGIRCQIILPLMPRWL